MTRFRHPLDRFLATATDFAQAKFYRALAKESENRLRSLQNRPGTKPREIRNEEEFLKLAREKLQRVESRLNFL